MKSLKKIWGIIAIGVIIASSLTGCPDDDPAPPPAAATGLYLGIIGFNDTITARNVGLLTADNKTQFQSFINNLEMRDATGLYYALDNAIDKLQAANLPNDLTNVAIITFTDGLDNASIELNPRYATQAEYRNAIAARITNTKIRNFPITAYSVGIRGPDVLDGAAFQADLRALASDENNVKEVASMSEVDRIFSEIANSLFKETQTQTISVRMPSGYDSGTIIRFTFDDVTNAADSNLFIEGTYRRSGSSRTLEDINYSGLSWRSGTRAVGRIVDAAHVSFSFVITPVSSVNIRTQNVQQWEFRNDINQWQRNSEFGNNVGDIETTVDRKSAVIMLVLDCTTSLTATGFQQMKDSANNFIDVLLGGTGDNTTNVVTGSITPGGALFEGSILTEQPQYIRVSLTAGTTYTITWDDIDNMTDEAFADIMVGLIQAEPYRPVVVIRDNPDPNFPDTNELRYTVPDNAGGDYFIAVEGYETSSRGRFTLRVN